MASHDGKMVHPSKNAVAIMLQVVEQGGERVKVPNIIEHSLYM